MQSKIIVRGAREHNLKNITIEIPRNSIVVFTGVSGSGKSTLAFDTIYAEGQRRYVESLSSYARQFLELMEKPEVDSIEGLSPAISIEQKTTSRNPRSTVATVTEIYDYMRVLFARIGIPYSPSTGLPIESQTVSQMVDQIDAKEPECRLFILAPIIRGRKGEYKKDFKELQKKGFTRVRVDGEYHDIEEIPPLDKNIKHEIEVLVDRLILRKGIEKRIADSLETALGLTDGIVLIEDADSHEKTIFSANFACPVSGFTISEIEPRLFSFNNPRGACPVCDGLGTKKYFDPELIIPDCSKTLRGGALAPWTGPSSVYYQQTLAALGKHFNFSLDTPFSEIAKKVQDVILYGSGKKSIKIIYSDDKRSYSIDRPFEGVIPSMDRRFSESDSSWTREELSKYQTVSKCEECNGARLNPEALAVKIDGKTISDITAYSITEALRWFSTLSDKISSKHKEIASGILKEIYERLSFLNNVGLDYLTLSRSSGTLSGGESQRIRLASQIGSGLTGVLYVLDEPSIGLHQRDNARLIETLQRLRDIGNSVIVVEHDEDAIRAADYLVDLGQGAGIHGGEVIASGKPSKVILSKKSLTAKYLRGEMEISIPTERRKVDQQFKIKVLGARENNLQILDVEIPLGLFNCVTGVSGSGKSSLIIETLYKAVSRKLNGARVIPGQHKDIKGLEFIDKIVDIDQSPIGRTPRSNPATYTGAFTPIRDWYAGLPEAKLRGYKPGRFSFNVKGGRCEACEGDGVIKIEMHFLADVYVQCDVCNGLRYNRETLEVLYKNRSIADVLNMTVSEGLDFFSAVPSIRDKLAMLLQVGLGYIKIGQPATTLSGGEAQRIKLSKELAKRSTGKTLYILDEPTTGLHFDDIKKLLEVLHALVDSGNTVIVIEHNLDVIKTADWVIDMGPEGGNGGGKIVATGTPEEMETVTIGHTGRFLASYLERKKITNPVKANMK